MTDEEITELVLKLVKSWRHRPTNNTKPFEYDMIEMCKKIRDYKKENTCD